MPYAYKHTQQVSIKMNGSGSTSCAITLMLVSYAALLLSHAVACFGRMAAVQMGFNLSLPIGGNSVGE